MIGYDGRGLNQWEVGLGQLLSGIGRWSADVLIDCCLGLRGDYLRAFL